MFGTSPFAPADLDCSIIRKSTFLLGLPLSFFQIELPKITCSFQNPLGTTITIFLPFSPYNQRDWKTCLIKLNGLKLPRAFKSSLDWNKNYYFFPFSPSNQGDWMCLNKSELSKITYSFQILFKFGLKLLLFCCFLHVTIRRLKDAPDQN